MIANLQPYPEYKELGLSWLGGIPRHWDTGPGFAAFREKQVKNTGMREKTVLSLSYGRIVVKPPEKLHGLVPESFETYQIVDPDDIIIRSTDLQNDWNSLRVGLVRNRGIITSAYLCFRTTGALSAEYGYQLLHTFDLMKVFYGMGSGLRQNLDFRDFKRMLIFVPPPEEQAAMVRFLAYANGRLERAIRAKRKVIVLLNEQKQAIIHRAVTRGVDPTVPLKPSGIPWLGDIPKHWEVRRNSWLFDERIEKGREGVPILVVSLRTGVTKSSEIDEDGRPKRLIANVSGYKFTERGDIAYNMMRMWQGAVGVVPIDGLVSPAYVVAKPRRGVFSGYFELLFRTDGCKNEINRNSRGIVSDRNRLYWDQFKRLYLPLPPFEEQKQIVADIGIETKSLNTAITRLEREIALLREYRTRLVADVITGKLDVREVARQLPEETAEVAAVPDTEELSEPEPEEVET